MRTTRSAPLFRDFIIEPIVTLFARVAPPSSVRLHGHTVSDTVCCDVAELSDEWLLTNNDTLDPGLNFKGRPAYVPALTKCIDAFETQLRPKPLKATCDITHPSYSSSFGPVLGPTKISDSRLRDLSLSKHTLLKMASLNCTLFDYV